MNFLRSATAAAPRAQLLRSAMLRTPASSSFFSTTPAALSSVARMTLIGRVGNDIAVSTSKNNRQYITYNLAVNTSKEHTSWFKLVVFDDNQITFMENYVTKGNLVYVEASASQQTYTTEDKKTTSLRLIQQTITKIRTKGPAQADEEAPEGAAEEQHE